MAEPERRPKPPAPVRYYASVWDEKLGHYTKVPIDGDSVEIHVGSKILRVKGQGDGEFFEVATIRGTLQIEPRAANSIHIKETDL